MGHTLSQATQQQPLNSDQSKQPVLGTLQFFEFLTDWRAAWTLKPIALNTMVTEAIRWVVFAEIA